MKRLWTAIIITALVSALTGKAIQDLEGPGRIFNRFRTLINGPYLTEAKIIPQSEYNSAINFDESKDTRGTYHELLTCPWCIAPYVTLPTWLTVSHITGVHGWRGHLLGYAASTALSAFIRHAEDRY